MGLAGILGISQNGGNMKRTGYFLTQVHSKNINFRNVKVTL